MIINSLILAFLIRLLNLDQSLWLDEAIGALVVRNMNFWDILTKFPLMDNHPPLYYLVLKVWTFLFGYTEVALRLPSVFFGVLTAYLVHKITRNRYITLLVATSPFLVYYSQEARMYMMAAFLATWAVYLYLNKKFIGFSIAITLLIFTDYVPVFLLPVFIIYSVIKKENVKKTLLSYLPMAVLGLFWLPTFLYQINVGKTLSITLPAWQELAGGATIKQVVVMWNKLILGRISFFPKTYYYLLVVISSVPFVITLIRSFKKVNLFFWMWFLIPLVLGFVTSFIFPAFIYFRFLYVVPAFYILVGQTKNKILISMMLLVNLIGCGIYLLDKNQQRESWKEAVSFVESTIGEDEAVVINYPEAFAPYRWYSKDKWLKVASVADSIFVNKVLTENKVERSIQNEKGVYYFNYLEDLTDPSSVVRNKLTELGFENIKTYTFNGVGEVEYLRLNENSN